MADPIVVSLATTLAANVITITAGKKWIDFKFEKELEKHRAELNRQNEMDISKYKEQLRRDTEKELARLNAELEKLSAEHASKLTRENDLALTAFKNDLDQDNLRFSHSFKECAEAIRKIYTSVIELRDLVNRYFEHSESTDNIQKMAFSKHLNKTWDDFDRYFQRNKILIPPSVAKLTRNFCLKLHEYKSKYGLLVAFENSDSAREDIWQKRCKEVDDIMSELPKMLQELADECQRHLGFSVPESSDGQSNKRGDIHA